MIRKMDSIKGIFLLFIIMSSIGAFPFQFSSGQVANSAPVLEHIGENSEDENDSTELTLSATDPDPGDILTFTSSALPAFVTLTDNGDRTAKLVFETSCNDAGFYSITITVTDDGSPKLSDAETFTLEIQEDCDATSPEEMMEDAADQIVDMINDGNVNEGQGDALIAKLDAAVKKLDQDNEHAAENILNSVINQIEAFIKSGVLTQTDGQALIDDIQLIINAL